MSRSTSDPPGRVEKVRVASTRVAGVESIAGASDPAVRLAAAAKTQPRKGGD